MVRVMDPPAALDDDELQGDDGEIEIPHFKNASEEASHLADTIKGWIENDSLDPSNIAALVSKQQNLYCQELRAALRDRKVPFREEDQTQDFASEPVVRVITDFLLVVGGGAQPEAFRRLLEAIVYNEGLDEEQEYRARSRWDRFVADIRARAAAGQIEHSDRDALAALVAELIELVGRDAVVALSADYAQGNRLDQLIEDTVSGTKTFHSTCSSLAPSIRAASSNDCGMPSKKLRSRMMLKPLTAKPIMMPK